MMKVAFLSLLLASTSFGVEPPPVKQTKQLPLPKEVKKPKPIVPFTVSYEVAYREALKNHKPFLTFVGVKAAEKEGDPTILRCEVKKLEGFKAPCVVAARYENGKLIGKAFADYDDAIDWAFSTKSYQVIIGRQRSGGGGC